MWCSGKNRSAHACASSLSSSRLTSSSGEGDSTKCLKVRALFPFHGSSLPHSALKASISVAQSKGFPDSGSRMRSASGVSEKLKKSRASARPFFSRYLWTGTQLPCPDMGFSTGILTTSRTSRSRAVTSPRTAFPAGRSRHPASRGSPGGRCPGTRIGAFRAVGSKRWS